MRDAQVDYTYNRMFGAAKSHRDKAIVYIEKRTRTNYTR